ncbi:PIN domain-containing protein [Aceticella autotrophica]|uniref:PIN domain-containing protein n=1 Tax=Aceticella autotrophica TaxID=2755338 RepID=A0A975GB43_9THEO|nr:PIN domain-containing protein [Aceticella autotrophica]QSZ27792.1 PIN domain-containing protein [Aceticella autotrophica]
MKILIDTNVILDVLLKREPFAEDGYTIFKMADENVIKAYLAAFAVTDIYYFINKNLNHDICLKAIKALFNIMNVASVTRQDIEKAMAISEFNDLEDALQLQLLKKVKGNFIITRNEEFQKLTDKAISPKEFVQNTKNFKNK